MAGAAPPPELATAPGHATQGATFGRRFNRVLSLLHLPDQRQAIRHPCWLPVSLQSVSLMGAQRETAVVVDVSRLGLCMVGSFWIHPGSFLAVRLGGPLQAPHPMLVKLVRAQPVELDACLLGGVWLRQLSNSELNSLLRFPSEPQ